MEIQNIIATADFGCEFNLPDIKSKRPDTNYNPTMFSALTLRIKKPKATAQVFRTGKIVCLGTKSEEELCLACTEFARILKELGYTTSFKGYAIKNLVASCSMGFRIHLTAFQEKHGGLYEPELFPALHVKLKNVTLLIFQSGKIIATGAKTKHDINYTYAKILPLLLENKIIL